MSVSLPRLQEAFQRYLLSGDPQIGASVVGTRRVPIETRLSIYGDGYRLRLAEALEATFPVLAELLEEADFQVLSCKYIDGHESTFPSIRYYGDKLAEFLASDAEYAKAPILAELARWEWGMAAVFDAADAEPIDVGAFANLAPEDWPELRFEWSPSAHVFELEWNVPELWKAVTENTERPDPELKSGSGSWLLWRRDLQIYFRPVAPEEAAAISASRAGRSFAELCEILCEHLDEERAPQHAAGFLRGWVESGLIVGMGPPQV